MSHTAQTRWMPYGRCVLGETVALIAATSRRPKGPSRGTFSQQLDFHRQLADPLHRLVQFDLHGIPGRSRKDASMPWCARSRHASSG